MIDWDGPTRQPCPDCSRGPKDKTCGVTIDARGGVAHCFRCGYIETTQGEARAGARPVQNFGRRSSRTTTQETCLPAAFKHERLSEFGDALWNACRPLAGEARAYLEARACLIPPVDGDLRWHPALKHPVSGLIGPAMVALVTDAITGRALTLHRTWIQADGSKAPVDPARLLLGGHRKAGGVIRLWPDDAVTTGLGVAEGIETALSLAHAYRPAWACIDAGNLKTFPVLPGIESLLIAADHDAAGIEAAEQCAQRWADAGRSAAIALPPEEKTDMNDVARLAA